MGAIIFNTEGSEYMSPLMVRRTLLELVAIRYAVKGVRSVPLGRMLADAGLSAEGREASLVLRAAAQNNVVYVDHQEMYRTIYLRDCLELDVIFECNHGLVAEWVARAGGGKGVHSFGDAPQGVRDAMVRELDGCIDVVKKHLAGSGFDRERGCYVRLG